MRPRAGLESERYGGKQKEKGKGLGMIERKTRDPKAIQHGYVQGVRKNISSPQSTWFPGNELMPQKVKLLSRKDIGALYLKSG